LYKYGLLSFWDDPVSIQSITFANWCRLVDKCVWACEQREWRERVHSVRPHNKLRSYALLKQRIQIEPYLLHSECIVGMSLLCGLRVGTHSLRIETGRFEKLVGTNDQLPSHLRYCRVCMSCHVEDEMHFLLHCPVYSNIRSVLFQKLSGLCNVDFDSLSDVVKFRVLLCADVSVVNESHISELFCLCKNFVSSAMSIRRSVLRELM